jgi:hypothetical protein
MKAETMPVIENRLLPGGKPRTAPGMTELSGAKAPVTDKELGAAPLADHYLATRYLIAVLAGHRASVLVTRDRKQSSERRQQLPADKLRIGGRDRIAALPFAPYPRRVLNSIYVDCTHYRAMFIVIQVGQGATLHAPIMSAWRYKGIDPE